MLRRVGAISLVLLFLLALCLLPPAVADSPSTSSSSSKKKTSSSAPSSSSSSSRSSATASTSSSSSPTSPVSGDEAEARLTRKASRIDGYARRLEQQTRRVKEKASKALKKFADSRKRRLSALMLRAQKESKAAQRSEAYWANKKDSTSPAVLRKGEKKLQAIAALSAQQGDDSVIRVKAKDFSDVVATSPRPYWVLLSLTALSPSYECKICAVVHEAFVAMAPAVHRHSRALLNGTGGGVVGYNALVEFNATTTAAERERIQREVDDAAKKRLPVFVVEADIDDNRNAFNAMQLTSAPTLVLLPPSFSAKTPAVAGLLASVASKYRYVPQSLDMHAGTFIDFVNGHVEPKVEKTSAGAGLGFTELVLTRLHSFNPVILLYFSIIAAGLLLFALVAVYRLYCRRRPEGEAERFSLFSYFLPSGQEASYTVAASTITGLNFYGWGRFGPRLPLVLSSITFYFFCVSGGMFTIIKESEAGYETTASGGFKYKDWISHQYMDQTVAESTVLAGLYLALFALIVLLNSRTFYLRKEGAGWKASAVGGWLVSWVLSPALVLLGIWLVYLQLVNVYSKKNNYHWGWNWRWLNAVQWNKLLPYPALHKQLDVIWKMVLKRMW